MEVLLLGETVTTNGTPLNVGDQLPAFSLVNQAGTKLNNEQLVDGKLTLISVVPNLNTPICAISTKRFNNEVDNFDNVNFYTISTNTLDEQKDWCAAEGVKKMEVLSDADANFGKAMNLFIESANIDTRSIWVIDANGQIVYRQIVKEIATEPNYDEVLAFLNEK